MVKIVPFFSNTQDNTHCLQACVKSILAYFLPNKKFSDIKIDEKTGQIGGWTWLPPAAVWLNDLGLDVKLSCSKKGFNYKNFSKEGLGYLKRTWTQKRFDRENIAGAFKNISFVQGASREMVTRGLWIEKWINTSYLAKRLEDKDSLAIGKTIYEWLSGNPGATSHYIAVIKKYSPSQWRVHDPGLPPRPDRKVPTTFNNHSLFGDLLLIRGKKEKI